MKFNKKTCQSTKLKNFTHASEILDILALSLSTEILDSRWS